MEYRFVRGYRLLGVPIMLKQLISLVAPCVIAVPAYCAVPNDFDHDGVSDLTQVEIGNDKQLTWKTTYSSTGQTVELGKLGKEGDHLAMGQWLGNGGLGNGGLGDGTQIGIVALSETSADIIWTILDAQGTSHSKLFGKKGDLVVSGGDFDGNGVSDAVVVRLEDGKARWDILLNPFVNADAQSTSLFFGKNGDRAFFMRLSGDSSDSIGVIRAGTTRKSQARLRNMQTGLVRTFTRLPAFASSGARPRAFPVRQSSGSDLLGFQIEKKGNTEVQVFSTAGVEIGSAPFEGTGITTVGDFNNGDGFEVSFNSSTEGGFFNPLAAEVRQFNPVSGILVDEINVNTLGGTISTNTNNNGGSSKPGKNGDNSSGGGEVAQCSQTLSWPGSHVYKTVGSNHFTDVRRNTIGVILKLGASGPTPNCITAVDRNGRVLASLGLYARGAGWTARYYAGIGCGASTPVNGSSLAARARSNTGSSLVYFKFDSVCYGPIDATHCIGSQQC